MNSSGLIQVAGKAGPLNAGKTMNNYSGIRNLSNISGEQQVAEVVLYDTDILKPALKYKYILIGE